MPTAKQNRSTQDKSSAFPTFGPLDLPTFKPSDLAPATGARPERSRRSALDASFTTQRQDTVPGLYDFPAREYSIQGRWPSPDPAGLASVDPSNPQSWNRYAYVKNDPLRLVDPLGLCPDNNHVRCKGVTRPGPSWTSSSGGSDAGVFLSSDYGMPIFGNDIFDAISGLAGTFLYTDRYGNVSFGFSTDLYLATISVVDSIRNDGVRAGLQTNPYPLQAFQVYIGDRGTYQSVSGLIPDFLQAAADANALLGTLPSGAVEYYRDLARLGVSQEDAIALTISRTIQRDPGYSGWLGAWGVAQDQLAGSIDQLSSIIFH